MSYYMYYICTYCKERQERGVCGESVFRIFERKKKKKKGVFFLLSAFFWLIAN